jgi:hypothetical protein
VCGAPFDLPELQRARDACVDFSVALGAVDPPKHARWTDSELLHHGAERLTVWDRATDVVFWYHDLARFYCDVSAPRAEIVVDAQPSVPAPTIRHLLIDNVIPHLIARSGAPVLHGAGVVVDGQALVILGKSAVGKSTLSVAFARTGGALIADDTVVIDSTSRGLVAQPGYPSARLSKRTARALLGDGEDGRPFTHYSPKLRFSNGINFAADAVPVRGVVGVDRSSTKVAAGTTITTIQGHAACAMLVDALRFSPRVSRALTVERIIELAEQARVGQVTINHDLDALPDVGRTLLDWFHARS